MNEKNSKMKKIKTSEADRWDGGGGSVYHSKGVINNIHDNEIESTKKRVEGIKRDLKGSEREREIRRIFKSFAPPKTTTNGDHKPNAMDQALGLVDSEDEEVQQHMVEGEENLVSKAFDAKRVRQIGFDPRRKVNEEPKLSDKKVLPIIGTGSLQGRSRISMDGVLGNGANSNNIKNGKEEVDSDSDSDLDIVMADSILDT